MSNRKKTTKSNSKKKEQSSSKVMVNQLSALLLHNAQTQLSSNHTNHNEQINHAAALLQALLQHDLQSLQYILRSNYTQLAIIDNLVTNLVESKVAVLIKNILEIAQEPQIHYYIYPWLRSIYQKRFQNIPVEYHERIKSLCQGGNNLYGQIKQIQGKLKLIVK